MAAGCFKLSETDGARFGFVGGARSIGSSTVSAGSAAVGFSVTLGCSIGVVFSLGARIELVEVVVAAGLFGEKIDGTFIQLAKNKLKMNQTVCFVIPFSFGANNEGVSCAGFETLV